MEDNLDQLHELIKVQLCEQTILFSTKSWQNRRRQKVTICPLLSNTTKLEMDPRSLLRFSDDSLFREKVFFLSCHDAFVSLSQIRILQASKTSKSQKSFQSFFLFLSLSAPVLTFLQITNTTMVAYYYSFCVSKLCLENPVRKAKNETDFFPKLP
jgi:hypothetical protein